VNDIVEVTVSRRHSRLPAWLLALRPQHWVKNVLVIVPLAAAHQLGDLTLLARVAMAFAAFSMCASGQYVLNDLFDLEADRTHPSKRNRPLASGAMTRTAAYAVIAVMWLASGVIAVQLGAAFAGVLAAYVVLMIAYSLRLKHVVLLDAVLLAAGYSARVAAGAVAVSILPSTWLIAFCLFLFYSLALIKRYAELAHNRDSQGPSAHARGYEAADLPVVAIFGIASGYLAVLVLALYLTSGRTPSALYSQPMFIGLTAVLLLYWISYLWLVANRGHMPEDPVLFALRDSRSWVLVVLMGVCAWLAV
jgi:4-hydroxybenzoate polyprenyltransferase